MLDKQHFKILNKLAWPITTAMVASNLLLVVDTAMVGSLGPIALAGVAISAVVTDMLSSCLIGLSSAVQAITARRVGEGKTETVAFALHSGQVIAITVGSLLAILAYLAAPSIFASLDLEPAVAQTAESYFRVYVAIIPAMGINAAYRGFMNGIGKTKIYMFNLILVVSLNIFLNWVLIFGNLGAPRLEAVGAALASAISIYISSLTYTLFAWKHGREFGFGKCAPTADSLRAVLRLALPASVQQLMASLNRMILMFLLSTLGTKPLAASTIVLRLTVVTLLPSMGFAMAGATLVGQTLGRGKPDAAKTWGYDAVKASTILLLVVCLPMVLFPLQLAGLFISDPETIALAVFPMRLTGATLAINGCITVFRQCLNGAGDQKAVLKMTQTYQWLLGIPALVIAALYFEAGMNVLWSVLILNYLMIYLLLFHRWYGGKWQTRQV